MAMAAGVVDATAVGVSLEMWRQLGAYRRGERTEPPPSTGIAHNPDYEGDEGDEGGEDFFDGVLTEKPKVNLTLPSWEHEEALRLVIAAGGPSKKNKDYWALLLGGLKKSGWPWVSSLLKDYFRRGSHLVDKRILGCTVVGWFLATDEGRAAYEREIKCQARRWNVFTTQHLDEPRQLPSGTCRVLNYEAWLALEKIYPNAKLVQATVAGTDGTQLHLEGVPEEDTTNDGHWFVLIPTDVCGQPIRMDEGLDIYQENDYCLRVCWRVVDLCYGNYASVISPRPVDLASFLKYFVSRFKGKPDFVQLVNMIEGSVWREQYYLTQ